MTWAAPDTPVVKKFERPHPLTPLIRGWLVLVALFIAVARDNLPFGKGNRFETGNLSWLLLVFGGLVLIAALAGLVTWYFTRFVIDDDELRIETGVLSRTSKRIPFERVQSVDIVQPFAARLFGLVELRIEVGAGDSSAKLRYLPRARATQLREYLLTRAHGVHASVADLGSHAVASAFTDASHDDSVLVAVSPQRLVGSVLLSTEWLITLSVLVVVLVTSLAVGVLPFALPAVIPMAISLATLVSRRVIAMFNFTLAESPRGLRVTRGLTNLTSQSVPVDRIQGVKVCQSLLWRTFGWYRVDVDILGFGDSDSENNRSEATTVLLPVATETQVGQALGRVLPGFDLASVPRHGVPRRTRWLRWFDFWTLRYGWNDQAMVTEHGLLDHHVEIVPHAKTQSVRIEQGPLQRRLRLADVGIHTPKGPVNAIARQLDERDARVLALTQLDRARAARAMADLPSGPLIGQGGESEVFALDEDRVLRRYRSQPQQSGRIAQQLRHLYDGWREVDIGVQLPHILQIGIRGGQAYTIDRRFAGQSFSSWLDTAPPELRRPALLSFLQATSRLPELPSPITGFAHLIGPEGPHQFASLNELLASRLAGPVSRGRAFLAADGIDADREVQRVLAEVGSRTVTPVLVHGDVCPANAYVSVGPDGQPWVSGIGDFSPHTMNADPLLDLTGAITFLEMKAYPEALEDAAWLTEVAGQRWGESIHPWLAVYRRFYGLYFCDTAEVDPTCYAWCRRQLAGPDAPPG